MIYVLKLIDEKYYVGYTSHVENRIKEHFSNKGSSWTKLHKPVNIVEIIEGDKMKEKEITLQYMKRYGWENVRGAGWTAVHCSCPLELRENTERDPIYPPCSQ